MFSRGSKKVLFWRTVQDQWCLRLKAAENLPTSRAERVAHKARGDRSRKDFSKSLLHRLCPTFLFFCSFGLHCVYSWEQQSTFLAHCTRTVMFSRHSVCHLEVSQKVDNGRISERDSPKRSYHHNYSLILEESRSVFIIYRHTHLLLSFFYLFVFGATFDVISALWLTHTNL